MHFPLLGFTYKVFVRGLDKMIQVEIVVKGQLGRDWSDWFDGFEISHRADVETMLAGYVRDQAELRGILSRVADLGLELISVNSRTEGDT